MNAETQTAPPADPSQPPTGESPNAPPAERPRESREPQDRGPALRPVPFYPTDTAEMFRYASFLAGSDLVPRSLKSRPHDVLLVLLKGHDLGLKPMQALGSLHVVEGKVELAAQLMVALIRKSGLCEKWRLVHSDAMRATYVTRRKGDDEDVEMTYSVEDARAMGLLERSPNWRKMPALMLRRRCQSTLAREVYPDVVYGMYDEGELQETREVALGIDPEKVIAVDTDSGLAPRPPGEKVSLRASAEAAAVQREVDATKGVGALKERLKKRKEQQVLEVDGAPVLQDGEVPCAGCQCPIEGKKGDKCPACRGE